MHKGQTSAETITVFGISMLIVLLFMALGLGILADNAMLQGESEAYQTAHNLASAADEVFAQGEGASKIVQVRLMPTTNFSTNATYVGKPSGASADADSRTIMINYGTGEKSAVSQESVSGAFPPLPGIYRMRVVSQGNYVSIYPAVLDMSKASISVNMGQNDSRQVLLGFSKSSREAVNVTIASNWGITDIGFSLNQSTFTVGDLGASAALSFVGGTNATGIYASSLTINATGVETGTTEMILFPIVVAVQAG